MKKEKEDLPLAYFDRNYLLLGLHVAVTAGFDYLTYYYLEQVNPLGFIVGVPAMFFSFHLLWFILNPYALIYVDRMELKKTMLSNKVWYLIDIKYVSEIGPNGFTIHYNDGEEERINAFGINPSQLKPFRDAFNHHVCKSLVERED